MSTTTVGTCFFETLSQSTARFFSTALRRCIIKVSRWTRSLEERAADREGRTSVAVYDIIDAGPRHRFWTASLACSNCTLGLGYGMSSARFVESCKSQGLVLPSKPKSEWPELSRRVQFMLKNICHLDPSAPGDEEAIGRFLYSDEIVALWRSSNNLIASYDRDPSTGRAKGLWKQLEDVFVNAANARKDSVTYILPSGREKTYWNPHYSTKCEIVTDPVTGVRSNRVRRELTATAVRGQSPKYFNGGKITENLIQSLCRDIMTYGAVEIERRHPTWKFRFSVYDEVIFEVPYAEVDTAIADMPEIMCRGELIRDWTKGLPLAVEGEAADKYMK